MNKSWFQSFHYFFVLVDNLDKKLDDLSIRSDYSPISLRATGGIKPGLFDKSALFATELNDLHLMVDVVEIAHTANACFAQMLLQFF